MGSKEEGEGFTHYRTCRGEIGISERLLQEQRSWQAPFPNPTPQHKHIATCWNQLCPHLLSNVLVPTSGPILQWSCHFQSQHHRASLPEDQCKPHQHCNSWPVPFSEPWSWQQQARQKFEVYFVKSVRPTHVPFVYSPRLASTNSSSARSQLASQPACTFFKSGHTWQVPNTSRNRQTESLQTTEMKEKDMRRHRSTYSTLKRNYLKCQVLGSRGHCTTGYLRTSSS